MVEAQRCGCVAERGYSRLALVEASAAIDLARAAGAPAPSSDHVQQIEALRQRALDGTEQVCGADVDEALRIARVVLQFSRPAPSK